MNILAFIIGVVAYFVLSFVFKDIGLSFYDEVSLKEYHRVEMIATWVATVCSGCIAGLITSNGDWNETWNSSIIFGMVLFIVTLILSFLPISIGFVILFNIINIAYVLVFTLRN